jgi:hypothetical protein
MDLHDIECLRLASATINTPGDKKSLPRHRKGEKFLKGPIPWDWLIHAGKLPGKALHVANVIWFQAGIKNCRTIALSCKNLTDMSVERNAIYRGLAALESVGLISVIRHRGRLSEVTLLDVKDFNN